MQNQQSSIINNNLCDRVKESMRAETSVNRQQLKKIIINAFDRIKR